MFTYIVYIYVYIYVYICFILSPNPNFTASLSADVYLFILLRFVCFSVGGLHAPGRSASAGQRESCRCTYRIWTEQQDKAARSSYRCQEGRRGSSATAAEERKSRQRIDGERLRLHTSECPFYTIVIYYTFRFVLWCRPTCMNLISCHAIS